MAERERSPGIDPDIAGRLNRALTGDKETIFSLVDDPSMDVLRALLRNPSLDENHLLALLRRRDLKEEVVASVRRLPAVDESHRLKVALVRNPACPGPAALSLLPHLYLFELVELSLFPAATPDQKTAAERNIIRRLPALPLGTKITLARRATPAVVEALLQEGDPRLVDPCLDNPRLQEGAVFRFVASSRATGETISAIARHARWKARPALRLALLKNPKTPLVWFVVYLPALGLPDLKGLFVSRRLTGEQKKAVDEEMRRREKGRAR